MFFKKFIIPRKLNKHKENFVEENIYRAEKNYNERYLNDIKKDTNKIFNKPKKIKKMHL